MVMLDYREKKWSCWYGCPAGKCGKGHNHIEDDFGVGDMVNSIWGILVLHVLSASLRTSCWG